ncbi:MAG: ATP-grasp domain-containing protein [Dehalococcoidia bacterium]|nr:ATP-grasp domain-containing protein [Dehalococcoidia bacterium]
MALKVALIYNDPIPDRYSQMGEADAISDVLEEVKAVYDALLVMGHSVVKVPLVPPISDVRSTLAGLDADICFNLFEGFAGQPETEAMVAGMMAAIGKPFTGSAAPTLALALDKVKTKELLVAAGVNTPRYQVMYQHTVDSFNLTFPAIVKPAAEDASHGMNQDSVVYGMVALGQQVEKVCSNYGGKALVEEFLNGRELSATIMGIRKPVVLSISEIVFSLPEGLPNMLTFGAKWFTDDVYFHHTDPVCPAQIDDALWAHISEVSMEVYRLLDCRGYARVDMRLDADGHASVLEVNPNPDISLTSGAVRQASAIGLTYPQFVDRIVQLAFGKE